MNKKNYNKKKTHKKTPGALRDWDPPREVVSNLKWGTLGYQEGDWEAGFIKVMKKPGKSWSYRISFSRPGKSWNLSLGHGKSWKMVLIVQNKIGKLFL